MKKKRQNQPRRYGRFSVRPFPAVLYGLLFVFLMYLSQLVIHPITAVFLLFFAFLPLLDLGILFLCDHYLYVEFEEGKFVFTRKSKEQVSLPLKVINHGFVPIPRVRILLRVPEAFELEENLVSATVMLPPYSVAKVELASSLVSRGVFTVGAEEVYVSDYLHLFRLRQEVRSFAQVKILPREISSYGLFSSLEGASNVRNRSENNQMDNGDVREYRPGDAIKSIHWKLSSKTETLLVKERSSNTGRRVLVICDLSASLDESYGFVPHAAPRADDAVAEEALAACREAVLQGATGNLLIADGVRILSIPFRDLSESIGLADFLARAKGRIHTESLSHFMETIPEPEDTTALFLSSYLSADCLEHLKAIARSAVGIHFRVCLSDAAFLLAEEDRPRYEAQLSEICRKLTSAGISVTVPQRKGEEE